MPQLSALTPQKQMYFFRCLQSGNEDLIIGFLSRNCKSLEEAKTLLNSTFSIPVKQVSQRTPLIYATLRHDLNLVNVLVRLGAHNNTTGERDGPSNTAFRLAKGIVDKEAGPDAKRVRDAFASVEALSDDGNKTLELIVEYLEEVFFNLEKADVELETEKKSDLQHKLTTAIYNVQHMSAAEKGKHIRNEEARLKQLLGSPKKQAPLALPDEEPEQERPSLIIEAPKAPMLDKGDFPSFFPDYEKRTPKPEYAAKGNFRAFRDICNALNNRVTSGQAIDVAFLKRLAPQALANALPFINDDGNNLLHYVMGIPTLSGDVKKWFIEQYKVSHPKGFISHNDQGLFPVQVALRCETRENQTKIHGNIPNFTNSIVPFFIETPNFQEQCEHVFYTDVPEQGDKTGSKKVPLHSTFMDFVRWLPPVSTSIDKAGSVKLENYQMLFRHMTGMAKGTAYNVCFSPVNLGSPLPELLGKGRYHKEVGELFGWHRPHTIDGMHIADNKGRLPIHSIFTNGIPELKRDPNREVGEFNQDPARRFGDECCRRNLLALHSYQPADPNAAINVDAKDNNGRTALHMAAELGYLKSVEFLIEWGASKNITDNHGKTPADLARAEKESPKIKTDSKHYDEIIRKLERPERTVVNEKKARKQFIRKAFQQFNAQILPNVIAEDLHKQLTTLAREQTLSLDGTAYEISLKDLVDPKTGDTILHRALRCDFSGKVDTKKRESYEKTVKELITVYARYWPEGLTHANKKGLIPLQEAIRHDAFYALNRFKFQNAEKKITPRPIAQLGYQSELGGTLFDMILSDGMQSTEKGVLSLPNSLSGAPQIPAHAFELTHKIESNGETILLRSALHEMVIHQRFDAIEKLRGSHQPAYQNIYKRQLLGLDRHGYTPLHHALLVPEDHKKGRSEAFLDEQERLEALSALLPQGGDKALEAQVVATPDSKGRTPFMVGVGTGNQDVINFLLDTPVNVAEALKRSLGGFPLPNNDHNGQNIIELAATIGDDDTCKQTLITRAAEDLHQLFSDALAKDIENQDTTVSTVRAVYDDYYEVITLLEREYGKNVIDMKSGNGRLVLQLWNHYQTTPRAIPKNYGPMFLCLVQLGANPYREIPNTIETIDSIAIKQWGVQQATIMQAEAYHKNISSGGGTTEEEKEEIQRLKESRKKLNKNRRIIAKHFVGTVLNPHENKIFEELNNMRKRLLLERDNPQVRALLSQNSELIKLKQHILEIWDNIEHPPVIEAPLDNPDIQQPDVEESKEKTIVNQVIRNLLIEGGMDAQTIEGTLQKMQGRQNSAFTQYYHNMQTILWNWAAHKDVKENSTQTLIKTATETLVEISGFSPEYDGINCDFSKALKVIGAKQTLFRSKATARLNTLPEEPNVGVSQEDLNMQQLRGVLAIKANDLNLPALAHNNQGKAGQQTEHLMHNLSHILNQAGLDVKTLDGRDIDYIAQALASLKTKIPAVRPDNDNAPKVLEKKSKSPLKLKRRSSSRNLEPEHKPQNVVSIIKAVDVSNGLIQFHRLPTDDELKILVENAK